MKIERETLDAVISDRPLYARHRQFIRHRIIWLEARCAAKQTTGIAADEAELRALKSVISAVAACKEVSA